MEVSDAVTYALKKSGKKQADLIGVLKVGTPQAANKKVREGRWSAEDLIAVAAFTGCKILIQMPDGEQFELK